jgi:6-phosphogluconolactonase
VATITILNDEEAQAAASAERIASLIQHSLATRRKARVCFAGGRTPRRLYERLADARLPWRARIEWTRVHAFWGDERHVPPDHAESNFGMTHRALLAHVPIPASQVHPMRGELADAAVAASEYERVLPVIFDVMLLGLGVDAHTASVFPGSPLLDAVDRQGVPSGSRVAAVWAGHLSTWRITLTPATLLNAHHILVLASGTEKAEAVHAALDGRMDAVRWPAQFLRAAHDRVEWIIDADAALWRGATPA